MYNLLSAIVLYCFIGLIICFGFTSLVSIITDYVKDK